MFDKALLSFVLSALSLGGGGQIVNNKWEVEVDLCLACTAFIYADSSIKIASYALFI